MSKSKMLKVLPAFKGETLVIEDSQSVADIRNELVNAHKLFAADYDILVENVNLPRREIFQYLFDFCKKNIRYEVESEDVQSVRSPSGILSMGYGDCKHYASFIAGVLSALNRVGYNFDWVYRFATYKDANSAHVFVVVFDNDGNEIWIDPVLSHLDQRYPAPSHFTDKKIKDMSLVRMSGIETTEGFQNETVVSRLEFQKQNDVGKSSGCNCVNAPGKVGYSIEEYTKDDVNNDFENPFEDGGGGGYNPPVPTAPTTYPIAFDGVRYELNGQPLQFPARGSRTALPPDLVIIYPETYNGRRLPVDLPKPVVAGSRLVLLPKLTVGVQDQYNANDWEFEKFITNSLMPLIQSYGQNPDWAFNDVWYNVHRDTDRADVMDYIQARPIALAFELEILESVYYFAGADPLVWPPDRNQYTSQGIQWYKDNPPPKMPENLAVVYPDFWRGVKIPDDLPRPVVKDGMLQMQPHSMNVQRMSENYYFWDSFLLSVITPLIRCYAQFPYTGNNDLSERVWNDLAKNQHLENYLVAPDRKTFLGEVIMTIADYVQEVTRLSLKVINFGSRLAFLGLVRINAFAFAYKLFLALNDPDRRDKLYDRWRMLGGNKGDFNAAIILGCKNNPIFGGGVKQWIEDAVQDGIIDNGYTRPVDDAAIPEGQSVSGTIGVAGVDDVVYYMAAASAMIAALGAFLKGIGGPEVDKVVDDVIAGYDVVLTAAGEDPIGTGTDLDAPVVITDPATGQQHVIYPPGEKNKFLAFVKANPVESALIGGAAVGAAYLLFKQNKKKRTKAA